MRKSVLTGSTARAVLTLALSAVGLGAGQAQAQETEERSEIIVTAQKREQAIQDVPIAINAFSGEQLENSNISDLNNLQTITPSLFVNSTGSAASDTTLRIRGVGTTGNNAGLEGAVGVFIDGVYRNRSGMALGQLTDIERIEVLRGPQSTLFGKNTSAGALSIITNSPEIGAFSGGGSITGGDPDITSATAWINIPLDDASAFRGTFGAESREGFIENRNTGEHNQDIERWFVRGQALFDFSPNVNLRLIADYGTINNNGNTAVRAVHAGARSVTINTIETNNGLSPTDDIYSDSNSLNSDPDNHATDGGLSAELNWDISPSVTITNIYAYRDYNRDQQGDTDFTGADVLNASTTEGYTTFSDEFRVTGETGALEWLAGAYWGQEEIENFTRLQFGADSGKYFCGLFTANTVAACFNDTGSQPLSVTTSFVGDNNFNPNLVIAGEGSEGLFTTEADSWSVFAQGTYHLSERLSATLGVRYIEDSKTGGGVNVVDNTNANTDNNSLPTFLGLVNDYSAEVGDSVVTGTANVQYEWTPDFMTYVAYSRGYKAAGINLDRTAATRITGLTGAPAVFDPTYGAEFSDNYEVGLKSQWMDGGVGLNLTAFYTEFTDLQILSFTGLAFIVETMPEARTRGIELETYVSPIDNLMINLGVTYAETRYGEGALLSQTFPTPPINLEGKPFTNAPLWSGSLGIDYSWPVAANIDAFFHTDYFYGSDRNTSSSQAADKAQDGYGLINFRTGLEHASGWDLSLWCRNCADEEYYTVMFASVYQNSASSPNVDAYIGNRREIGLSLSYDF